MWIAQSLRGGEDHGSEHGKQKHLVYSMLRTVGFRDKEQNLLKNLGLWRRNKESRG